jgi:hypothetical protein
LTKEDADGRLISPKARFELAWKNIEAPPSRVSPSTGA